MVSNVSAFELKLKPMLENGGSQFDLAAFFFSVK